MKLTNLYERPPGLAVEGTGSGLEWKGVGRLLVPRSGMDLASTPAPTPTLGK